MKRHIEIAGHVMGTSEYTMNEAIELFHRIGADGAEITARDGYCLGIPCDYGEKNLFIAKRCAEGNEIEVPCLTSYNPYSNSLGKEVRQAEIEGIHEVADYYQYLNAHYTRTYGGNPLAGDTQNLEEQRERPIESLRYLGNLIAQKDVVLIAENHFNTTAVSAKDSATLIRDVDHPAVRILYDQANLTFTGSEGYEEAISLQQQYVGYMHVKDLVLLKGRDFVSSDVSHPDELERSICTCIVGEGTLE